MKVNTGKNEDIDIMSQDSVTQLLEFIHTSPTCYHAIFNVANILQKEGFVPLDERQEYRLKKGGKYYVIRNDSSMIAFEIPKETIKGFRIIASHSDSPCFKLKENPEVCQENAYVKFNVEKYGGMILSTWLDRPLSVAGRVIVKEKTGLVSRLVNWEEPLCVIPNLAIHMNREMNKGVEYNPQIDMQPLWSDEKNSKIATLLAEKLQIKEEQILGTDLFVYNPQKGCRIGDNGAFIGVPRLDDLSCVFGSLQGFLHSEETEYIKMYCVFDHEEVGSRTRQGADSDFLQSTLTRIATGLKLEISLPGLLANSLLISADNGHALHPNHPEKSDVSNRPVLNGGILIKFHANQQYTTDGMTGAMVKDICKKAGVSYQAYHNRSDIPGGSTLGNISIAHCSIPSADVGLPQLAMHSAFETAGAKDVESFVKFAESFYRYE